MSMKWIVALACGSALALGACSSTPTPATTPTDPAPTDPGTPDPDPDPDEDTRTDAEKTFDTALGTAQAELAKVAGLVAAARTAAASTGTEAERTAATAAIKAATDTLAEAVRLANALTPPEGDATRRGRKVIAVNAATAAQTAQGTVLTGFSQAVAASGSWAARTPATGAGYPIYTNTRPESSALPSTQLISVVRRNRNTVLTPAQTNYGDDADAANVLDSESFKPVMYADGKYVLAQGRGSGSDWLRMRGIDVGSKTAAGDERAGYNDGGVALSDEFADENYIAGMRITDDGLGVQLGGKWIAGLDMVRDLDLSRAIHDSGGQDADNEGWDLSLTFGAPGNSPDGNGDFYWTAPLYIDESQRSDDRQADASSVSYRAVKLGDYQIWLANVASVDYNDEPSGSAPRGTITGRPANTGDDEVVYLNYAAYGAMTFARASGFGDTGAAASGRSQHGRIHVFNVGYDAFKDENGKKTTDLAADERITTTSGKFVGTTTGFTTPGISNTVTGYTNDFVDVAGAKRIRGNVELTATLGAGTEAISGTIKGVQYWDATRNSGSGGWTSYGRLGTDGVALGSASIDADGTFESAANAVTDAAATDLFTAGRWKGAFYGPTDALEVAGIWYLRTETTGDYDEGLVGSFGAKYQANPPSDE